VGTELQKTGCIHDSHSRLSYCTPQTDLIFKTLAESLHFIFKDDYVAMVCRKNGDEEKADEEVP